MTRENIAIRNHQNARKNTGPKSAEGKATVARNALRHGATARPDKESVATWLSIILDKPLLTVEDLQPHDDLGFLALALAEAEVRLVAADCALREFERGCAEPNDKSGGILDLFVDDLAQSASSEKELRSVLSLLKPVFRFAAEETRPNGRRHRLLKRYLREARGTRRRALGAFLDAAKGSGQEGIAARANLPKQSQKQL